MSEAPLDTLQGAVLLANACTSFKTGVHSGDGIQLLRMELPVDIPGTSHIVALTI